MNLCEMDILLKGILKPKRYAHSVNTMKVAAQLAEHYGENKDVALVSGLLHDCAKNLSDEELLSYCESNGILLSEIEKKQLYLVHGVVGAIVAKEKFNVADQIILNAIKYHTTGTVNMNMMEKIIFIADYIEPGRTHSEAEAVRKLAYEDIDKALLYAFDSTIKFVMSQNGLIHPATFEARNSILLEHL